MACVEFERALSARCGEDIEAILGEHAGRGAQDGGFVVYHEDFW